MISNKISPEFQKELDEMKRTGEYDIDGDEGWQTPPETDWIGEELDEEPEMTSSYKVGKPEKIKEHANKMGFSKTPERKQFWDAIVEHTDSCLKL